MYKDKLDQYFNMCRSEFVETICTLVRINSAKGPALSGMPYGTGPAEALHAALQIARCMDFAVQNYNNYIGAVDMGPSPRQLDILAHLDVVPAGDGWTVTQPFVPIERDGRLFGRGVADDKGPAVAALYAMKAIKDLDIPLRKGVRLLLGTDEECGGSDIEYYYAREDEAPMTFSPDAWFPLIYIEKGGLGGYFHGRWAQTSRASRLVSLDSGEKGNMIPGEANLVLTGFDRNTVEQIAAVCAVSTSTAITVESENNDLRIRVTGIGAHGSMPEKGVNSLTAALKFVNMLPDCDDPGIKMLRELYEIFPHGDWLGEAAGVAMEDEAGPLTISLNILHCGDGKLDGVFDCRTPLCATDENVRDVLKDHLHRAKIILEDHPLSPPHYVPRESQFVQTLLKCYRQYTGDNSEPIAVGGGTYVHRLKNGVAFGCAVTEIDNKMHGADEFAIVDQLLLSAKIFAQVIIDLCG